MGTLECSLTRLKGGGPPVKSTKVFQNYQFPIAYQLCSLHYQLNYAVDEYTTHQ